jgi:hypothetical protein
MKHDSDLVILGKIRTYLETKINSSLTLTHGRLAADQIQQLEMVFSHLLPPLLKLLYGEIGNGGFGPGYGLLNIATSNSKTTGTNGLQLYETFRKTPAADPSWHWPEGLLPVCGWGCGIYSCVDCRDHEFKMVLFDPNQHRTKGSWDDAFFKYSGSFNQWLEDWADGNDDQIMGF